MKNTNRTIFTFLIATSFLTPCLAIGKKPQVKVYEVATPLVLPLEEEGAEKLYVTSYTTFNDGERITGPRIIHPVTTVIHLFSSSRTTR